MLVEIIKDDMRYGLREGDRFLAKTCRWDYKKIDLIQRVLRDRRVVGKKKHICNLDMDDVKVIDSTWMVY